MGGREDILLQTRDEGRCPPGDGDARDARSGSSWCCLGRCGANKGGDNLPTLMGDNWLWCSNCFMEAEGGGSHGVEGGKSGSGSERGPGTGISDRWGVRFGTGTLACVELVWITARFVVQITFLAQKGQCQAKIPKILLGGGATTIPRNQLRRIIRAATSWISHTLKKPWYNQR